MLQSCRPKIMTNEQLRLKNQGSDKLNSSVIGKQFYEELLNLEEKV